MKKTGYIQTKDGFSLHYDEYGSGEQHIISAQVARDFYIKVSKAGWRTAEPSRIEREKPALFEQLVYRAVNEEEISVQRGAELLKVPFDTVLTMCHFNEV